jgi:hypothetical protein
LRKAENRREGPAEGELTADAASGDLEEDFVITNLGDLGLDDGELARLAVSQSGLVERDVIAGRARSQRERTISEGMVCPAMMCSFRVLRWLSVRA